MNGCFGVPTDILESLANELEASAKFRQRDAIVDKQFHAAFPKEIIDALTLVSNQLFAASPVFILLNQVFARSHSGEPYDDLLDDLSNAVTTLNSNQSH